MPHAPDILWAVNWALLGLAFAAYAARRAWSQHRLARRELAAVRRYGDLHEGEYASISGTAAKQPYGFDVVMEGGDRVRVEHAKVDGDVAELREVIIAVEAERTVYVSGIVQRGPGGILEIHAAQGQRLNLSTHPLWQRAVRRTVAHALVAVAVLGLSIELFRFIAWDALRLTLFGTEVPATLSNPRDFDEERFSLFDLGFHKVRQTRLDAVCPDRRRRVARQFTTVVDPDTEWLWSLRADQAEVRRLGIAPVVQQFVILLDEPSVHQLGRRVRLSTAVKSGPLALFVFGAALYWTLLVRPENRPRRRLFRARVPG